MITDPYKLGTDYSEMVNQLAGRGADTLKRLSADQLEHLHAAMGISGEAGELLDAVKKHVFYQQPLDYLHVVEELGDLEFYLEWLRVKVGVDREETLRANMEKLAIRYPKYKYTDAAAAARADKA